MIRLHDKVAGVIVEYHKYRVASHSSEMIVFQVDTSPEFSDNPEHPDYKLISLFKGDKVANVRTFEWQDETDEFEAGYTCIDFATWEVLDYRKEETVQERLNEAHSLVKTDIHKADHKIGALYEDYINDRVSLSTDEEDFMYLIIDMVSTKLYG